jgi:hypothetical protein
LLSVLVVLFFTSCSKTNKEGRNIPLGAAFVIHLNGESLSSKLPWDEIKKSDLFKEAYGDSTTSAFVRSVLDNPENAGIDIKKDILFFAMKDSAGGYMAVEGTVKDESKFKQFSKEMSKNTAIESQKAGINYSSSPTVTTSWNKEKFVFVMDAPMFNKKPTSFGRFDTASDIKPVKRDMVPVAEQIFSLKEDMSLGKDEKFTDLMKTTGDIHFWVNIESFASGAGGMGTLAGPLSMINLEKLYKDSRATGTVNFENGKITAEYRSYSGKEMAELMKKYSGDKINSDMVKRIPSKNVAALLAFSFKPEGIREYLKLLSLEGFANMGTSALGVSLDDIIKATKGDIVIAVTDLAKDSLGRPDAAVLFSTSIGDKASFGKLVEAGKKMGGGKFMAGGPSIFSNMNDKYFAIGNNKTAVDTYIQTEGKNSFDFLDKISGSAGGAYINFQYLLKTLHEERNSDSLDHAIYDASVKMWDNFISYGEGFKSGGHTQHFEVNLVDKTTNSLKQLNNYLGVMGTIQKEKKARRDKLLMDMTPMQPDSIFTIPVPDTVH